MQRRERDISYNTKHRNYKLPLSVSHVALLLTNSSPPPLLISAAVTLLDIPLLPTIGNGSTPPSSGRDRLCAAPAPSPLNASARRCCLPTDAETVFACTRSVLALLTIRGALAFLIAAFPGDRLPRSTLSALAFSLSLATPAADCSAAGPEISSFDITRVLPVSLAPLPSRRRNRGRRDGEVVKLLDDCVVGKALDFPGNELGAHASDSDESMVIECPIGRRQGSSDTVPAVVAADSPDFVAVILDREGAKCAAFDDSTPNSPS